jgi:phosphatidylinositol-3-phosphatase
MGAQRRCGTCESVLDADQRYCLACGARAGERSPQLRELIGRVGGGRSEEAGPDVAATERGAVAPVAGGWLALRLPGPWVSALLVLLFVGFGALLGDAGAGAGPGRLAASSRPLKLLVPASKSSSSSSVSTGGESEASTEPPEAEPEATPSTSSTDAQGSSTGDSGKQGGEAQEEGGGQQSTAKAAPKAKLSEIGHVFLIVLSDEPYASDFGPESKATYLAHTLAGKGELLPRYDAIAHEHLPNGIALLSGQGPSAQTAADCPVYTTFAPGTASSDEQVLGDGCAYPLAVKTLPGQLTAKRKAWRAYIQGIDEAGVTAPACAHPEVGASDPTAAGGAYATFRNPIVYFQSLTISTTCTSDDIGLGALAGDLSGPAAKTPALSYIVPDRCHDASPVPCTAGAPSGPADADSLLQQIVPKILASKAYKKDGLLVITSDEAPSSGELADSTSCCGQPAYPNFTSTGFGHGGGAVGALLLSPFIKGGGISQETYNHYSLLKTIEDAFGLAHLGYAALPAVKPLSTSLLNVSPKG